MRYSGIRLQLKRDEGKERKRRYISYKRGRRIIRHDYLNFWRFDIVVCSEEEKRRRKRKEKKKKEGIPSLRKLKKKKKKIHARAKHCEFRRT